jgi:hypothetical protein
MRKRTPVLAMVLLAVVAITSVMVGEIGVASIVVPAIVVGLLWIVAQDVRRAPVSASSATTRGNADAAYTAGAFAALHGAGQGGADCASGFDSFSGGDCGGGSF